MKSPFKFLNSYTFEDRSIFFGRDQEITDLHRKVFESKILLVYGLSGTGKSSLVNCGLASQFDELDWLPVHIRFGNNIIKSLNEAINKQAVKPLRNDQNVTEKIHSIYLDHFKPVYLIFDQFEELFVFGSHEERANLVKLIKEVVESELHCRVIFIIREEFLAGLSEFEEEIPGIFSNRFRVEKMKRASALQAIEGPCKVNDIETEQGFTEELVSKLCPSGYEIELTYLQIYLDRIFNITAAENRTGDSLIFSKEVLAKAGTVSDLLGQFLDEQIRAMEDPDIGMSILKSFVSVQGIRKRMTEADILDSSFAFGIVITEAVLLKYLARFVDLRILRERDESGHFELIHDSLAAKIYEKFTALEKDIIEVRQFIENEYSAYEKRGKLLTPEDLKYIAPYEDKLYLSKQPKAFINKSKYEITRARRRRRKIASVAGLILFIVLSGFTIWALMERGKAVAQSHRSKVLLLVAKAKEAFINDPTKAMRYVELAYKYDSTNALANQTFSDIFHSSVTKPFYELSFNHTGYVGSAVFSPDGKNILTASFDNTIKLWDLSGRCLVTFSGHSPYKNSAIFSPDGKNILTASINNGAKLWDFSGKCIATFSGHTRNILSIAFSPDGKNVLTASGDKTAKLWDISGHCIATLTGHDSPVSSALFSPDCMQILSVPEEGPAKLWDRAGKCLVTFSGHKAPVLTAVFSPDGKKILTASADNTAKLWDLSGKCLVTLQGHVSIVQTAVFSGDGRKILTASVDNSAKLWDISGNCIATLSGHTSQVMAAIFSPDDSKILTSSGDNSAKLWDLSGKCLVTMSGHKWFIWSSVYSPDGTKILTASNDNTAKLWDLSGKCLITLAVSDYLSSSVFSPSGENILTASNEKTAKLWDLSGNCIVTLSGHAAGVISAVFSHDGKFILTSSYDSTARLWNLDGKCLITLSGHSSQVITAVFSPDSKNILTSSLDKTARLWDLAGNCLVSFTGHTSGVVSAVYSPDGKSILTSSSDNTAKLWDLAGKCLITIPARTSNVLQGFAVYANSAFFSPDGKTILAFTGENTIKLWDLTGQCLTTLADLNTIIWTALFSPDGKTILTGLSDGTARLWDLSGKCISVLSGHKSIVMSAVFSPDGKYILTASDDYTAKIWDLYGKCYATLSGHTAPVWSGLFSPDGRRVLTVSWDNTTKLWTTPSSIYSWLQNARIGVLSPSDKDEIEELADFEKLTISDNVTEIIEYAYWYSSLNDTAKAVTLYERALQLNPESVDRNILGKIYLRQNKKDKYGELFKSEPLVLINYDLSSMRLSTNANDDERFRFYSKRSTLFEKVLLVEPTTQNKITAAANYNSLGYYGLLAKQYSESLKAIQRGIELDSSNVYLYTNLPLGYLFTDQFDKAKSVYLEFKDKPWTATEGFKTFGDAFLTDLRDFESKGISHPYFEKVRQLLK
jgi:WD40 repeat protein